MNRITGTVALLIGIVIAAVPAAEVAQDTSDNPAYQAIWKIVDTSGDGGRSGPECC